MSNFINQSNLPPPIISLPLIIGLTKRMPDAAGVIVSELICEYDAYCIIQRALLRYARGRRRQTPDSLDEIDCACPFGCRIPIHMRRHWIWRAFLSNNLRIRRVAFQILLAGMEQLPGNQKSRNFPKFIRIIQELADSNFQHVCIDVMLQDDWEDRVLVSLHDLDGGEPILQIMGVLNALVMRAGKKAGTSKEVEGEAERTDGQSLGMDQKGYTCEEFVASGGLRWVVNWMKRLTIVLSRTNSAASTSSSDNLATYSSLNTSVFTRLHILTDFAYKLCVKNETIQNISIWQSFRSKSIKCNSILPSLILIRQVLATELKGLLSFEVSSNSLARAYITRICNPIINSNSKRDSRVDSKDSSGKSLKVISSSRGLLGGLLQQQAQIAAGSNIIFGRSNVGGSVDNITERIEVDDDDDDDVDNDDDDDDDDDDECYDKMDGCQSDEGGRDEDIDFEEVDVEEEIQSYDGEDGNVVVMDDAEEENEDEDDLEEGDETEVENISSLSRQSGNMQDQYPLVPLYVPDAQMMDATAQNYSEESRSDNNLEGHSNMSEKMREKDHSTGHQVSISERKKIYLSACVVVLESQFPPLHFQGKKSLGSRGHDSLSLLSPAGVQALVKSMCGIVKPPAKPLALKVMLRRTPTQEEFFRGSLSKSLMLVSSINCFSGEAEPLMSDLRRHIATDLQMTDSAELLELLVGGKIIDLALKVRVVQQVHWRKHVLKYYETGYSSDSSISSMPPMVVTYRLAGVDGEATEDVVEALSDPEGSGGIDPEVEFAITRDIAEAGERRIFPILLRSIDDDIGSWLMKIRRDDINLCRRRKTNPSKEAFMKLSANPALVLFQYCSHLKSNRKLMVQARAPTKMLKRLLDILGVIDSDKVCTTKKTTTEFLQDIIEILASDISTVSQIVDSKEEEERDVDTIDPVLHSLTESSLAAPLRKIIADLLPFLTYGQKASSRALAMQFLKHVDFDNMLDVESSSVLMETFIQTAISLPPVNVCNELRSQLIEEGFTLTATNFLLKNIPNRPPPWSLSLFSAEESRSIESSAKAKLEKEWKEYFVRQGLAKTLKILIGLSSQHRSTQNMLAENVDLVRSCHWMESTSDTGRELGLLAETLLDGLKENNEECAQLINAIRQKTKARKREIAGERRSRALDQMKRKAKSVSPEKENPEAQGTENTHVVVESRSTLSNQTSGNPTSPAKMPAWMQEMEAMEDERGLTCAVCQEGQQFQPSELLGLYCYIKKISISNKSGFKPAIDGTLLLLSLPLTIPHALNQSIFDEVVYTPILSTIVSFQNRTSYSDTAATLSISRNTYFVNTLTAGNAIHFACHSSARHADRNHPKAPKGEWEGASLRNNRVSCNAIMPLVTSLRNPEVSLVSVDTSLSNYQATISNIVGSRPKSMLWTILHDLRILLLRIAHGESLSVDCGGGSLSSNTVLIYQQLQMAEMCMKNAEAEANSSVIVEHVRSLGSAFVAGVEICNYVTEEQARTRINRSLIESSVMASICCILFHKNNKNEGSTTLQSTTVAKDLWKKFRTQFVVGLIRLAGRRKCQGIEDSGCVSSRPSGRRKSNEKTESILKKRKKSNFDDISRYLRPSLVLIAIFDNLSSSFKHENMSDEQIAAAAEVTVDLIKKVRNSGINVARSLANLQIDDERILSEFEKGVESVQL